MINISIVYDLHPYIIPVVIQIAFGIGILAGISYKMINGFEPLAPTMAVLASLALIANAVCFVLLFKHRSEDINMRSVWLCSRNDVIGNIGVLCAASLVALTGAYWPDVLVGSILATLFVWTGIIVLREAVPAWQGTPG